MSCDMSETNAISPAPLNQKSSKSLAQRHIAKLREESLALRAQSDTFSAEVAALEELFRHSEDTQVGAGPESEKKIWESLQRLLHKRYLAEMNSLRTAAALTGRQLPMKAPSTSSESDTSYASSPASHLPTDKLDDVGSKLTTSCGESGDSGSDHMKSIESGNDSTDTPPHSNDEGSATPPLSNDEGSALEDAEERGSVFSFSPGHEKNASDSPGNKPSAPPSEVVVPKPRWFSGPKITGPNPTVPFGAVLNSTVPPVASLKQTDDSRPTKQSTRSHTERMTKPKRADTEHVSTRVAPSKCDDTKLKVSTSKCNDTGYSAAEVAAAKCAAAMERSAAAMVALKEVPVEVQGLPKVQAPIEEPAPAAPKEVRHSELIAQAREARAAAARKSKPTDESRVPLPKQQANMPPFPPHLREMADELKQQISELQSSFGVSRTTSLPLDKGADEMNHEAEKAVAKAREMLERAPQKQSPFGSNGYTSPRPLNFGSTSPRPDRSSVGNPLTSCKGSPPPSMQTGLKVPRDHALGQSAPNLPTYPCDAGLPRTSPRASPRASPTASPRFNGSQALHCTAPTISRMPPSQAQVWNPDAATGHGPQWTSPALTSRGGHVPSPAQHGRQGRVTPQALPSQGYPYSQIPPGQRNPSYAWNQSQQTGRRC
eukprot:gnl/MRDRNA2_/MRDRNA2_28796_c0_seq1.p1 gnl/MRDRNA2_/MRDRNA2_28796_c0~~gnl/MRDRNA2_/MRDRNA2_28796_c0_seq1.p1  ORF type:complete len:657 (-),score=120.21 gnl/MRDRNA2_/MRDRNA2_28796_c0_seq1:29-1999(-)